MVNLNHFYVANLFVVFISGFKRNFLELSRQRRPFFELVEVVKRGFDSFHDIFVIILRANKAVPSESSVS